MAKKETVFLYGRNSVAERLKADPESIRKIYIQDSFKVPEVEALIKEKCVDFERRSAKRLSSMMPAKDLQGIIAAATPFRYTPLKELLSRPDDKKLTLVFLDRINDPHNLGVIIRTVACFGGFAVVIPEYKACAVNETVMHVASGGENYVPVSLVTNLSDAIIKAKDSGYWIAGGLLSEDAQPLDAVSFPFPLALVLGSEGEGIRYGVEKHLDIKAHIPMKGPKLSFNVNIACAIFCHEINRQRKTG